MRWAVIVAMAGCGRVGFDAQGAVGDGGTSDSALAGDTGSGGAAMGSGIVSGTAPVGMFPSVMAAYVVGHPQIAGQTAIYLFSQPVTCAQLGAAGWPRALTTPTAILELVVSGASV